MSSESPVQLLAFDDMINTSVMEFLSLSSELGEPVVQMAVLVKDAFDKCRELIGYGLYNAAPSDEASFFSKQPLATAIQAIQGFREQNRKNADYFNHLSTVSESILALSWITIKPAPTQFIRDMKDAGQYFGNRVLANFKGNLTHANWINKWNQILKDLEMYVKNYFMCGFTWGTAGSGKAGGPAPPPPPPPPMAFPTEGTGASGDGNRQALLQQLNQGTGITNILRHVQRDQPRGGGTTAQPAQSPTKAQVTAAKSSPARPKKFILEGRKWLVEHQVNEHGLNIDNDMTQSLAMFRCENCYLEIKNKINNVVIDSCKKVNLLIKDVISSVEVIRGDRVKIQCVGVVPLINISNSDSVEVYVDDKSRNVEVISSRSSALNISVMKPDGDYVEFPVPEQIKSVITGGARAQLTSSVVDNI